MTESIESNQRNHRAVERLFPSLFALRYSREPHCWEMVIGQALVYGDLTVTNPPRDARLRACYYVAEDVRLALRLNELIGEYAPPSA